MGVINWVAFGGILVDLVIVSVFISSVYWGYRKGLVSVIFKILVFIISLIIMFLLYKPVSNSIMEKTQLDEKLAALIESNLAGTTLADGNLLEPSESNFSTGVVELINDFVKEALKANVSNAVSYVSVELAHFMIRVATMIILLIVSRFLLVFVRFASEIIANLPVIKLFNKSGGLIYGVIKGFLVLYSSLAVFSVVSPLTANWGITDAIQDSTLGSKMYNNNLVVNLIIK